MSFIGPYAGAKTRFPLGQLRYQPHSVKGRAKCPADVASVLNVVNSWLVHALLDSAPGFVQ